MKKKLFFAILGILSLVSLNAQEKLSPRVEAAMNFGTITSNVSAFGLNASLYPDRGIGVRASAGAEYSLGNYAKVPGQLYLYSGLNYSLMNMSIGAEIDDFGFRANSKFHYLSLPVNIGIRTNISAVSVSAEVGPYLSYLLSTNAKTSMKVYKERIYDEGGYEWEELDLGKYDKISDKLMNRIEFGLGFSVALEYSRYYLRFGADYGLSSLINKSEVERYSKYIYREAGIYRDHHEILNDILDFNAKKSNIYLGLGIKF